MKFRVAVIGGGVAGLSAAFELKRRRPEWPIVVLEKEESPGGKVRSSSEEGFRFDWGPNGFQPSPETLELVSRLGLRERLVPASDGARYRYLFRGGGLRRVPTRPQEFLTSELLSPAGKVRAALEPLLFGKHHRTGAPARAAAAWDDAGRDDARRDDARRPQVGRAEPGQTEPGAVEATGDTPDESVHDFIARHFGAEAAARLAGPMVLGVAAGDARALSVDALFPRLRRMEAEHGSLLRAMAAARGKRAMAGEGDQTQAPAALYSFSADGYSAGSHSAAGMGVLTTSLAERLDGTVRTGAQVTRLTPAPGGGFDIDLAQGERLQAEQVVVATPAHIAAPLLRPFLPSAATPLAEIASPDVDVFALGFHRVDVAHPLDGFGFLVPRGEGVRCLGVLWTSSLFPDRAPHGRVLLRVIAGGALDPQFSSLETAEAMAAVRRDLRVTLGITAEPLFSRRLSFAKAIPQYELGHGQRVNRAMSASREFGGLVLAGNAYFGVSVNDCLRDAGRVADELLDVPGKGATEITGRDTTSEGMR